MTAAFGVSLKAVDARVSGPAGSCSRRSVRPPGQVSLMTRWVVALLEGVRTAGAAVVRAPSRARTSCGACRRPPIAVNVFAPVTTAEHAISRTTANG
ncbi:hypothetical protein ACR6C2_24405 [Streptomyces sp. INA 01156]